MSGNRFNPTLAAQASVVGLQQGRDHARRRSARRRVKNMIVSGVMFVIAGGVVGTAGYLVWQFYGEEQERNTNDGPAVDHRSTEELIVDFESNPRFNGPGAPAFGIGDDEQP